MLNRLSFGQYEFKDSIMHKLDPRVKIINVIFLSILVFAVKDFLEMLVFSFFVIILIIFSGLHIKILIKNLRPFYFIFIFIFLMYVLFSRNNLGQGSVAIWRFLILIIISFLLTFTTPISRIIAAIERLTSPLKILNIKPRNIAIMISMTIRFIPVMFIDLERLKESMLARLANFRKLKFIKIMMLSLLERLFKSASTLSDAMQARLYNEDVESNKKLKMDKYDYISLIIVLIFILTIY